MPWATVIGVPSDMRRQGSGRAADPALIANALQREMQAVDRNVAKFSIQTVADQLGEQTSEQRFDAYLAGGFAATALFSVAFGIYTLLYRAVAGLASWLPSRAAARIDPLAALRGSSD